LQQQLDALETRLRTLENRREQVPAAVAKARAAVAFIWAAYAFVDEAGRPLRHVLNEAGEPIADVQGIPKVDVTGTGTVAALHYSGTAFLVDRQGHLLTNRHIAEPWWENEDAAPPLAAGYRRSPRDADSVVGRHGPGGRGASDKDLRRGVTPKQEVVSCMGHGGQADPRSGAPAGGRSDRSSWSCSGSS
jgi:hypothetical protein